MLPTSAAWRTPPATRSASTGRPAERQPKGTGPLERDPPLRVAFQREARFAYLVARLVPALRQRHVAGHGVPAETAEGVPPPRITESHQDLTSQPPGLGPIATDLGGHGLEHDQASFKLRVYFQQLADHVAWSTSSRNRRRLTRRWHHAYSIIASRSPVTTVSGMAAMARRIVVSRPLS